MTDINTLRPRVEGSARPSSGGEAGERIDGRAIAALVCGTLGLLIFNIVLGPMAIGLGVASLRGSRPRGWDRTCGLLGIALGVADIALLIALLAPGVGHGGIVWHFGS